MNWPKMKRVDRILEEVISLTREFDLEHPKESLQRLHVSSIAEVAGISPNNASTDLMRLYRDGVLARVGGRPASYLAPAQMEEILQRPLPSHTFENPAVFMEALFPVHVPAGGKNFLLPKSNCKSTFEDLIGAEYSLQERINQAKAAMVYPPNGLNTLITGPTGSGKSLFAKCMYDYAVKCGVLSQKAAFVTFNCANYSDNPQLLLSQLFGYSRGAFTGAVQDRPGLVEAADHGVLFLDEIHRLNQEGQEKLFLLLDKGSFMRLGETQTERHVNLRLIGATTESPEACMLGTFLRRIPAQIVLPSLAERSVRERMILALYFLWKEARQLRQKVYISADILQALVHYNCPGNVGQLESDIRLTCANIYYKFTLNPTRLCQIRLPDLSTNIQRGLISSTNISEYLVNENLSLPEEDLLAIDGYTPFEYTLNSCLRGVHTLND